MPTELETQISDALSPFLTAFLLRPEVGSLSVSVTSSSVVATFVVAQADFAGLSVGVKAGMEDALALLSGHIATGRATTLQFVAAEARRARVVGARPATKKVKAAAGRRRRPS